MKMKEYYIPSSSYVPNIVTKDAEDRKIIVGMIKRLYKIRSGLIHHEKKSIFEMGDLVRLQRCLRLLIVNIAD